HPPMATRTNRLLDKAPRRVLATASREKECPDATEGPRRGRRARVETRRLRASPPPLRSAPPSYRRAARRTALADARPIRAHAAMRRAPLPRGDGIARDRPRS